MFRTTSRTFRAFASAAVVVCVAAPFSHAATVTGRVLDSTTSLPLAGVEVLVDGVPLGVTTDLMGQFSSEVGEGERLFTFRRTGFSEKSVGPLALAAEGEVSLPDSKLYPEIGDDIVMLEALDVRAELVKGSSGDLQNQRMKADVAIDFLSADQLAKFSAGDAAEAIIRIPGVSVANGQFAVIRGLSDRFLSTTLHGLKLPSPDPEKQAFQMDLLPASAVGSIVVSKTYGPELWGESGGGNIDIATNAVPEDNYVKLGAGVKVNSNALDGGVDYSVDGGSNERFGFGTKNRPAVGELPKDWQYAPTTRDSFPVGSEFSVEMGRVFAIRDNQLGVRLAAENEEKIKSRSGHRQKHTAVRGDSTTGTPGGLEDPADESKFVGGPTDLYTETETENVTSFNTTVAYDFAKNHQLKFDAIYVQSGIDTSYLSENELTLNENLEFEGGENPTLDTLFFLQGNELYRERNLTAFQLSGDHEFDSAEGLRMSWAVQTAEASQNDSPFYETRFASPLANPHSVYILSRNTAAPTALTSSWIDNTESQNAGRLDFSIPKDIFAERESTFDFGVATDRSEREVTGLTDFKIPENDFFNEDYVDLYQDFISSNSFSSTSSSYPLKSDSERDIDAAYLGTSLATSKWMKVVGGLRVESFSLSSSGGARWGNLTTNNFYSTELAAGFGDLLGTADLEGAQYLDPGADDPVLDPDGDSIIPVNASQKQTDVLPAVGLVFDLPSKVTTRLAFSQTVGRPSGREVSPFFNKSIETQNLVVGNPALEPSSVNNYDFRVEWNPSAKNAVAVSLFYKQIENPIEKIIVTSTAGDVETWINNPNTAEMAGVELEVRAGLGQLTELLDNFSVGGNFTYIDAEVDEHPLAVQSSLSDFADPSQMQRSRRLYDQPEYIVNGDLTWKHQRWGSSATFAAYAISDVLIASGLTNAISIENANYDLYQRAYVRCDLILGQRINDVFSVKFSVKNLFDPVLGTIYDREALGRVVERNAYHAGREFSLTVAAEF